MFVRLLIAGLAAASACNDSAATATVGSSSAPAKPATLAAGPSAAPAAGPAPSAAPAAPPAPASSTMWKNIAPSDIDGMYSAIWGRGRDEVFAAGPNGALIRTRDRGKTWQKLGDGFATADLAAIAGDDKVLLVAGNTGERKVLDPGGRGVPPRIDIANHGAIFRSEDAGATFTAIKPPSGVVVGLAISGHDFVAVTCNNSDAVIKPDEVGKTVDHYQAFLRSTDRGKTWKPETISIRLGHGMVDQRLCDVRGAIAYRGGMLAFSRSSQLFTHGAGAAGTWKPLAGPPDDTLVSMWWDGKATLWASQFGGISRSVDAGATWELVNNKISVAGMWGSSPSDIYAVGGHNQPQIFHTTDGGKTWASEDPESMGYPGAVWGSDADNVYAVAGREILKRQ